MAAPMNIRVETTQQAVAVSRCVVDNAKANKHTLEISRRIPGIRVFIIMRLCSRGIGQIIAELNRKRIE